MRLDHEVTLKSSLKIRNNLPLICINLQLVGFNASYERKTIIKFAVLQFHFVVLNEIIVLNRHFRFSRKTS